MTEKQHITINIADVAPLDLKIPRNKEEMVRRVVSNVNILWSQWSNDFKQKSSKEILAMVAYEYAKRYYELQAKVADQQKQLGDVEQAFDAILLDVK